MKLVAATAVAAAGTLAFAPAAHAVPLPPQCQQVPWGFLGTQTRQICDGPRLADGSWMRHRVVGRPAYWRNETEECSTGSYTSTCTFYPAGEVPEYDSEDTWYPVRDDNVPAGEPGHLPG